MRKVILAILIIIVVGAGLFFFISSNKQQPAQQTQQSQQIAIPSEGPTKDPNRPGLANPASVYCLDQKGKLDIRVASDGGQTGYCILPDGKTCEEWDFFRTKTCK